MDPLRSNRYKRPFARQNSRVRKPFSPQERLETAAVRKVGACKDCQVKKAKCRHTIHESHVVSNTTKGPIFPLTHNGSASTKPCQNSVQKLISATELAKAERSTGSMCSAETFKPAILSTHMNEPIAFGFHPILDEHTTSIPNFNIRDPITFDFDSQFNEHITATSLSNMSDPFSHDFDPNPDFDSAFPKYMTAIPAFNLYEPAAFDDSYPTHEHSQATLLWQQSQNFTMDDVYNASIHSSTLNTPKDHDVHSLYEPFPDHFDANKEVFAMETLASHDLPVAEEWMQHPTTGTGSVEAEPLFGGNDQLNDNQMSYTEFLFNSDDD